MIRAILPIGLRASARCLLILIFALSACQSSDNNTPLNAEQRQASGFSIHQTNHRDCVQPQSSDDDCQDDGDSDDGSVDDELDDAADDDLDDVDSDDDEDSIVDDTDADVDDTADDIVSVVPSALPSYQTIATVIAVVRNPPPIVLNPPPTVVPLPRPCDDSASRSPQVSCKPSPTPTLAPCMSPNGGTTKIDSTYTANALINSSPALQALMAQLSNSGISVTITAQDTAVGGSTTAAAATMFTNPTSATIAFNTSQMQVAENEGQDPSQILFHELDHAYYQTLPGYETGNTNSTTFTINGTTYMYDTADVPGTAPNSYTDSTGERAWGHMLIHNDLVNAFGSDMTGAIGEGLAGASNGPGAFGSAATQGVANMDRAKSGTSSRAVTPPSLTARCKNALQAQYRTDLLAQSIYIDTPFLDDTY